MTKSIKTKLINLSLLITLILSAFILTTPQTGLKSTLASSPTKHLQEPSHTAVLNENIYIYDETTSSLITRPKRTSETEEIEITASKEIPGMIAMEATETGIIALVKKDEANTLINISPDLETITEISIGSYTLDFVIDLSYDNGIVYLLKSNTTIGEIDKFSLAGNTLTPELGSITKSYLGMPNEIFLAITHKADLMFLQTNLGLYKLNLNAPNKELVLTSSTLLSISYEGESVFALDKNNALYKINPTNIAQTQTTLNHQYEFSNLTAADGDNIFLSSPNSHQIYTYSSTTGTLADLKVNETIKPIIFSAKDFRFVTLNIESNLYLQPYSMSPKLTLSAGSKLTIIGNAPGEYAHSFYFTLVETAESNHYLYLKKEASDNNFSETKITSSPSKYVAIRRVKLYSHPSSLADGFNTASENYLPQTEFSANSEMISSGNESFLRVHMADGTIRFAPSSSLQPIKSAVELTIQCNAKTKRETMLSENADGTGEIITISKNTRVKVLEEITPNKKYVLASYQTENGITYTGYLFTEDIDPDGLSTLQILGLVLIIVNILVLLLIILIKFRSKKWKIKTNS